MVICVKTEFDPHLHNNFTDVLVDITLPLSALVVKITVT